MLTINRNDLMSLLVESAKGTKIIGITYTTEPKLNKKHRDTKQACPFTNVKKTTEAVLMLGVDYANRLAKQGEEPAGAKPWFTHVDGQNWLVQHNVKGTYYLRVSPTGNNIPKTVYTSDQGSINKNDLLPFLPPQNGDAPEVFTIGFENINFLTIAGKQYQVVD